MERKNLKAVNVTGWLLVLCLTVRTGAETPPKQVICPVKGTLVNTAKPSAKTTYKGKTYYFCSKAVMKDFKKNPEKFLKKTFVCPIDRMKMPLVDAVDAANYKGKMYHFCSDGEREKFLNNPDNYLKPKDAAKLPNPNVDGRGFQQAMLKEMPEILAQANCWCGCKKNLRKCYVDAKCPPT